MTLNETVIDFYIQHSFVNIISIILNNESISESAKSYLINSLYTIYMESSTNKKNKLLDLYVKYKMLLIIKRILNDVNITYSQIKKVCTALSDYKDDSLDEWLHNEFLDFNFILNPDFIPLHIAQSTYILINTPLDEISDPTTINSLNFTPPFIDSIISNYDYYNDHDKDWLNQLINSYTTFQTFVNILWVNGIRFTDNNLKFLDSLEIDVSSNSNLVKAIRKNFSDYIRCECLNIIKNLYDGGNLSYNEYRKIDLDGSDEILDILIENYQHANASNYNNSLLSKVNTFELAHIFMYLLDNNCLDQDEIDFFISRPDCNQNLKTLLLSTYSIDDLDTIDKENHYSLFLEVFRYVFYTPFIYDVISGGDVYSDSELAIIDSKYSAEIVRCTSDENMAVLASYAAEHNMLKTLGLIVVSKKLPSETAKSLDQEYSDAIVDCITDSNLTSIVEYSAEVPMYNVLSKLIYEKNISDENYNLIRTIDEDDFRSAMVNNIGDSDIKTKSYKLLTHECLDLFHHLVVNCLSDQDCYDFCFTNNDSSYKDYRDFLVSRLDSDPYSYNEFTKQLITSPFNKINESTFNKIKQNAYSSYSLYSDAYNNSDKSNYNTNHPNYKIAKSANVLFNIIIWMAFNYTTSSTIISESLSGDNASSHRSLDAIQQFLIFIDEYFTVICPVNSPLESYNAVIRDEILSFTSDKILNYVDFMVSFYTSLNWRDLFNNVYYSTEFNGSITGPLWFICYYYNGNYASDIKIKLLKLANYSYDNYKSHVHNNQSVSISQLIFYNDYYVDHFYTLPTFGIYSVPAYQCMRFGYNVDWSTLIENDCTAVIFKRVIEEADSSYSPGTSGGYYIDAIGGSATALYLKDKMTNHQVEILPFITDGFTRGCKRLEGNNNNSEFPYQTHHFEISTSLNSGQDVRDFLSTGGTNENTVCRTYYEYPSAISQSSTVTTSGSKFKYAMWYYIRKFDSTD